MNRPSLGKRYWTVFSLFGCYLGAILGAFLYAMLKSGGAALKQPSYWLLFLPHLATLFILSANTLWGEAQLSRGQADPETGGRVRRRLWIPLILAILLSSGFWFPAVQDRLRLIYVAWTPIREERVQISRIRRLPDGGLEVDLAVSRFSLLFESPFVEASVSEILERDPQRWTACVHRTPPVIGLTPEGRLNRISLKLGTPPLPAGMQGRALLHLVITSGSRNEKKLWCMPLETPLDIPPIPGTRP